MLSGSLPEKSNLPAVVYTEPAELAASSEMAKVTSRVSTRTLDDDTNANVNNRQNKSRCNIYAVEKLCWAGGRGNWNSEVKPFQAISACLKRVLQVQ